MKSTNRAAATIAHVRAIDAKTHRVTAMVSTTSVDRHGTIFLPEAFQKSLPNYLAQNPILLWGHQWHGAPSDALGVAVAGRVVPNRGLEMTFEYAVDANPVAKMVLDLIQQKVIRAFSVGCYVLGEVTPTSSSLELDALPQYARQALLSGECTAVYTEVELVEVSQVLLGSNRDSIIASINNAAARHLSRTLSPNEVAQVRAVIGLVRAIIETSDDARKRTDSPAGFSFSFTQQGGVADRAERVNGQPGPFGDGTVKRVSETLDFSGLLGYRQQPRPEPDVWVPRHPSQSNHL